MLKHSFKQSISSMLHPTPSIWPTPPHRRGLPRPPFSCSTLVLKPGSELTPGTVLSCHPGVLFSPCHAFLFLYLVHSWGGMCPCWRACRTGVFPKPPVSLQTTISGWPQVCGSNQYEWLRLEFYSSRWSLSYFFCFQPIWYYHLLCLVSPSPEHMKFNLFKQ